MWRRRYGAWWLLVVVVLVEAVELPCSMYSIVQLKALAVGSAFSLYFLYKQPLWLAPPWWLSSSASSWTCRWRPRPTCSTAAVVALRRTRRRVWGSSTRRRLWQWWLWDWKNQQDLVAWHDCCALSCIFLRRRRRRRLRALRLPTYSASRCTPWSWCGGTSARAGTRILRFLLKMARTKA